MSIFLLCLTRDTPPLRPGKIWGRRGKTKKKGNPNLSYKSKEERALKGGSSYWSDKSSNIRSKNMHQTLQHKDHN